jgi:energy-coupling factor transporter ATP-binding protein EcfA2
VATRAELIEAVLARRVRRNDELDGYRHAVTRIAEAAEAVDTARSALYDLVDDSAHGALDALGASLAELRRRGLVITADIDRAGARFQRPNLTIGTIGRSGQGKSRLLQSLTGLTDREIPAGRGGFMTGVPSQIRHADGPTRAEVEFHDERSFLDEVIGRYYAALGLGPAPASLDEFARREPPPLPETASSAENQAARDHLLQYRAALPAYRSRLTERVRILPIGPDDVRRFVAQHDAAGAPIHEFRAVRTVRISTRFNQPDLGRLALVDLPGLGDTNLGDAELLRRALGTDVDVAVFVKRPDPIRYGVEEIDVKLYDTAWAALPDLPLDRWSFMLLNRVAGGDLDNGAAIDGYQDNLRGSRIRVVDVVTADCTDAEQVATAFDIVLGQLVTVIDGLDRVLLDRRRHDAGAFGVLAFAALEQGRAVARLAAAEASDKSQFLRLFRPVQAALSNALEELCVRYAQETTVPDPELKAAVDRALEPEQGINSLLPSEEQLAAGRGRYGAWAPVLTNAVLELRAAISRRFLGLEGPLELRVGAMHGDIAAVLAGAGRLGPAVPDLDGLAFLRALDQRLPDDPLTAEIRYGLWFVCDFTLHYRGLLQHRVRRALAGLEPDKEDIPAGTTAKIIRYWLEEHVAETFHNIRESLQEVLVEPQEAVFAVVEEFRDRALRAAAAEDGWQVVYEQLRAELWPEQFQALAENTALYRGWSGALDTLEAAAAASAPYTDSVA